MNQDRRPANADFSMNDLLQRLKAARLAAAPSPAFPRMPRRLLYAVNHSMPFSSNGYAVRTHGVATALMKSGVEVIAATRPGMPWDRTGFNESDYPLQHRIDGVRYVHTRLPSERVLRLDDYLAQSVDALQQLMRVFKPSAVLAASNWRNALPAAVAARELGLPFCYEVRGFWEISQASRNPEWAKSEDFLHEVARETTVAQAADKVFTINRFMRDELVRRGVARERVELVPNGFPGWPKAGLAASAIKARLGIKSRFVVGYVGSFNGYEGLEDLIEAVALVRKRGVDVSVLLVGSSEPSGFGTGENSQCPSSDAYRELAQRLDVADYLFLPGRVVPDQAADYYSALDIVIIPRRPFAVCEIVSPMKPLEAASYGKRVLMSDVAPLADLAALCPNFRYFAKGNVASLADKLAELLLSPMTALPRCEALGELTWEHNVAPMVATILDVEQKKSALAGRC